MLDLVTIVLATLNLATHEIAMLDLVPLDLAMLYHPMLGITMLELATLNLATIDLITIDLATLDLATLNLARYAQNYKFSSSILEFSDGIFQVVFTHCSRTAIYIERKLLCRKFVPGHAKLSIIIIADRSISLSSLFDFLTVKSKSRPLKRVSISF